MKWGVFLIAILVPLLSITVSADVEPNDSSSHAEALPAHPVTGEVSVDDEDVYSFSLAKDYRATVTLSLNSGEEVSLQTLDEHGNPMYFGGITLECCTAGEENSDEIVSSGISDEEYNFWIRGNGTYSLHAEKEKIPSVADEHSSKATAMEIDPGSYQGDVTSGGMMSTDSDDDYYVINVPEGNRLTVSLTAESFPEDDYFSMMTVEGECEFTSLFDLFYISLEEEGDRGTAEFVNDHSRDVDYYLIVSGGGEYTLDVALEDVDENEVDMGTSFMTGLFVICGGLLGLVVVGLLVAILIVMLRKDR